MSGHYDDVLARGRRGTVRVALVGGCAAVALVAAVVALLSWASAGSAPATAPANPQVATGSTSPEAPGAEVLATPGLDVTMPDDLVWHNVRDVLLPYSASKGPRNTLGGLASGFAHDAQGAVLAAAHIAMRINPENGPAVFEPTLREQVVGPGVVPIRTIINEAYTQLRQQAGVPYGDPAGQISATLLGFRVERYTDNAADVRLVTEGPDGQGGTVTVALLLQMQWSGDDWALFMPAGEELSAPVALDDDSTYTMFGA